MSMRERLNVQATPELEVPIVEVFNEVRLVKQECRQLRAQVETVAPMAASEAPETAIAELVSRQDALTAQMECIENHFSTTVQDRNNATDSTRRLWDRMEQCSEHVQRLQDRFHDLSDAESDRDIETTIEYSEAL